MLRLCPGRDARPTQFGEPVPGQPGRAQLGDRGELVRGDGEPRPEQGAGLVDAPTVGRQCPQIGGADGQHISDLGGVPRAGAVRRRSVDDESGDPEIACDGRNLGNL